MIKCKIISFTFLSLGNDKTYAYCIQFSPRMLDHQLLTILDIVPPSVKHSFHPYIVDLSVPISWSVVALNSLQKDCCSMRSIIRVGYAATKDMNINILQTNKVSLYFLLNLYSC